MAFIRASGAITPRAWAFPGFFESNGNGVRLSKAVVFRPGRVPVIAASRWEAAKPYAADTPDAVRGPRA